MVDKSKRATLNITQSFKQDLDRMRLANESYEEIIKREIGGYNGRLINVREPIAFELKGQYSNKDDEIVQVHWSTIQNSELGDHWQVKDYDDCIHRETATVIYKDKDVVLVKFKTYNKRRGIKFYDVETVSYNFFTDA